VKSRKKGIIFVGVKEGEWKWGEGVPTKDFSGGTDPEQKQAFCNLKKKTTAANPSYTRSGGSEEKGKGASHKRIRDG